MCRKPNPFSKVAQFSDRVSSYPQTPLTQYADFFYLSLASAIIESKEVEVRKPFLVILAILFSGLVLLGLSDTGISIADTSVLNSEATSSVSKAGNPSTSATITITMYTVTDE